MNAPSEAPIKSNHAQLLNRLSEMQASPYYKTCACTLILAEQTIVKMEQQIATLQASNEAMSDGFKAAKAFIDCHVADPDITNEMRLAYAHYKECCAAIQNRSELGK